MSAEIVTCACGCGESFVGYIGEFWSPRCVNQEAVKMSEQMIEPTKREMTSPIYVLRGGAYLQDEYAGVMIDDCGNYAAKTRGDPRALVVLLRAIAEDIEGDIEAEALAVASTPPENREEQNR
jgi:hypothetical protein